MHIAYKTAAIAAILATVSFATTLSCFLAETGMQEALTLGGAITVIVAPTVLLLLAAAFSIYRKPKEYEPVAEYFITFISDNSSALITQITFKTNTEGQEREYSIERIVENSKEIWNVHIIDLLSRKSAIINNLNREDVSNNICDILNLKTTYKTLVKGAINNFINGRNIGRTTEGGFSIHSEFVENRTYGEKKLQQQVRFTVNQEKPSQLLSIC